MNLPVFFLSSISHCSAYFLNSQKIIVRTILMTINSLK